MMSDKQLWAKNFQKVFNEIDSDNSGTIGLREFEENLMSPKMRAYFASMDVDVSNAWQLFKLLDQDNGGAVDLEEFVQGLLHLKGGAKAIQLAELHRDNTMVRRKLEDFVMATGEQLRTIMLLLDEKYASERFTSERPTTRHVGGHERAQSTS